MKAPNYSEEFASVTCEGCPLKDLTEEFWGGCVRDPYEAARTFGAIRVAVSERNLRPIEAILEIDDETTQLVIDNNDVPRRLSESGKSFAACPYKQFVEPCALSPAEDNVPTPDFRSNDGVNVLDMLLKYGGEISHDARQLRDAFEEIVLRFDARDLLPALKNFQELDDESILRLVAMCLLENRVED